MPTINSRRISESFWNRSQGQLSTWNTSTRLVGGISSDITVADKTFIDVSPRLNSSSIDAHAHNGQVRAGTPAIERHKITGNRYMRSGGPAMNLIDIEDSLIEHNINDSPNRSTIIASTIKEESDYQAIMLHHCKDIVVVGNKLNESDVAQT